MFIVYKCEMYKVLISLGTKTSDKKLKTNEGFTC